MAADSESTTEIPSWFKPVREILPDFTVREMQARAGLPRATAAHLPSAVGPVPAPAPSPPAPPPDDGATMMAAMTRVLARAHLKPVGS